MLQPGAIDVLPAPEAGDERTAASDADGPVTVGGTVVEDVLIEDVSIDGMCGVY